jgi:plastocyanin
MSTRSLYALLGVAALVVVGLLVYNQSNQDNEQLRNANQAANSGSVTENLNTDTSANTNVSTNANAQVNNNTNGQFSDETDLDKGQVFEISYNGVAFAPANLSIKAGDTVVFKNNSTKSFWPASAPHPQHTNYPEFDARQGIAPGQTFQFKFLKVGSWGFHDHLSPTAFGKITVAQ